jgi:hypothetical protein
VTTDPADAPHRLASPGLALQIPADFAAQTLRGLALAAGEEQL